jgi:thiol-disulfide isomerase/thioredoxin
MKILPCWAILLLASSFAQAADKEGVEIANAKGLSERRGQVAVLAFWATWRPPCRSEMPALARPQKELAAEGVSHGAGGI